MKVDVLEVRQVELDNPSDDPGDRLHASAHAAAHAGGLPGRVETGKDPAVPAAGAGAFPLAGVGAAVLADSSLGPVVRLLVAAAAARARWPAAGI